MGGSDLKIATQFKEGLTRASGNPQVNVSHQRNPLCPRNSPCLNIPVARIVRLGAACGKRGRRGKHSRGSGFQEHSSGGTHLALYASYI